MLTNINSLTPDELKRFSEFIRSPYFNKSEAMIKLFEYLKEKYPAVTAEDVVREKVSRLIFDDVVVNVVRMRKIESDFNILFEKFLMHDELECNRTEANIMLLRNLRLKSLAESFKKKIDDINRYSKNDFGKNDTFYLNKVFFFKECLSNPQTAGAGAIKSEVNTWLHLSFIFQILENNLSRRGAHFEIGTMINNIYEFIESNKKFFLRYHPDIIIFYYINLVNDSFSADKMKFLENYFNDNEDRITGDLKNLYYQFTLNALYLERSSNPTMFNSAGFINFLKMLIDKEILKTFFAAGSKYMSQTQYFTCFNSLVNFKEFDMAEKFAKDYLKYIHADYQDKMVNQVHLILSFFRKDFPDVITRLNDVKSDNAKFYVYSKYIRLMLLFEMKDFKSLEYEIQALAKYLNRLSKNDTLPEREIIRGKNFVKMITLLYGVKQGKESLRSKRQVELEAMLQSEDYVQEYAFWVEGEWEIALHH